MRGRKFAVGVLACAMVAAGGYTSAMAQPLMSTTTKSTENSAAISGGMGLNKDLAVALSSASGESADIAVVGIGGNNDGKYATTNSGRQVNPAFSTMLLALGLIKDKGTDGSVVLEDGEDSEKVTKVVEDVMGGSISASALLKGGYLDSITSSLQRLGLKEEPGEKPGFSPLYMARVMQEVKKSDGEGGGSTNALVSKSASNYLINTLREGGKESVLNKKLGDEGRVASLNVTKDGVKYEVGYIFDKKELFSYSLAVPEKGDMDVPGAIGRVMQDALAGTVKKAEEQGKGKATDQEVSGASQEELRQGHNSAPEGQSVFE